MGRRDIIVKDTHRALWYEDGVLVKTLQAGRYKFPRWNGFLFRRLPVVEVVLVDMRERESPSRARKYERRTRSRSATALSARVSRLRCESGHPRS